MCTWRRWISDVDVNKRFTCWFLHPDGPPAEEESAEMASASSFSEKKLAFASAVISASPLPSTVAGSAHNSGQSKDLRAGAEPSKTSKKWSRGESNPRPETVGLPPLRVCWVI